MTKIIFTNGVECEIDHMKRSGNLLEVFGDNIPQNVTGFVLIRDFNPTPLSFIDFKTIYKVNEGSIIFSNDGSYYTKEQIITVIWDDSDNYDGIRPEQVAIRVSKNGTLLETVIFDADHTKKSYVDSVDIPVYTIEGEGVQGYELTIEGLTAKYFHKADIPVPPPVPTIEERMEAVESDIAAIDDAMGGVITE